MEPVTLLLIDANSLIHRAFHALPPLTGPDGEPTQALYGLSSILLKIIKEEKPMYAAALFDRPEPTFREAKYKEYKAQRPAAPSELISQIIEAHNLFPAFGVPVFEKATFEADDLIATFAEKFKHEKGLRVEILTGDRDALQLIEDPLVSVRMFKTGVSETVIYDEAAVKAKYGLPPSSLIAYKSLVGDSSDNIKGLAGIGPKTASDLLQKYGSIDGIYEHLDELTPNTRKKFEEGRADVVLATELVTIERHVPIDVENLEALKVNYDDGDVIAYFEKFGFFRLITRLAGKNDEASVPMRPATPKKEKKPELQGSMF